MTIEADLKKRLFAQFDNSPNINELLEIVAKPLQDTNDAVEFLLGATNIDAAEGEQLENLAARIGVVRPHAQETHLFTLCRQGETVPADQGFTSGTLLGGYLGKNTGLIDQSDPDAMMSDADFRKVIRQKATSYRAKMTREVLFLYLIDWGAQCAIDDEETFIVWIDPATWSDLNDWQRHYIETRGFKPGTFSVKFTGSLRHEGSI